MTKYAWLGASALLFASCGSNDIVPVSLEAEGAKEAYIFRIDATQLVPWDTLYADGQFDTELPLDSTGSTFYVFAFDNNANIRLGIEAGDDIEGRVSVNETQITTYEIEGSELSEKMLAHYLPLRHTAMLMDSLTAEAAGFQGQPDAAERNAQLFARFQDRVARHKSELDEQLTADPGSLANIFAIFQAAGNMPLYNPQQDSALIRTLVDALNEQHPDHPLVKTFVQTVARP
ncbi:MAG: hypothetical protein ACO3CI_06265 [Schleiferiaceae bacterium]